MDNLAKIRRAIAKARTINVICHVNPDGDCIGSLLAVAAGLTSIGKRVAMISQDGVPFSYRRLPGAHKIRKKATSVPDMVITVDCSTKEMLGRPFDAVKNAKDILEIDHHEYRNPFGTLSLIDTKAAAVGEIVYRFLTYLNIAITKDIARTILTSIIVETNSFRLPTVRRFTFRVCERLLETGVDYHKLSELVYWSKTKEAAILSGMCLASLRFIKKGKLAWSIVRKKDFSRIRGKTEDVDAVANDILAINSVRVAIFFRETKGKLRVSLRSKGGINVAALANRYGGGGHFDAAGCYIDNTKASIKEFLQSCKKLVK